MGKAILYVFAAITAYLVGGINPAIVLSKLIYKKDIRTLGSKNPGFTNFKRVFGKKYAWLVFGLDLFKSALLCCVFGPVFSAAAGSFSLGAAYVGLFAMIGHAFPIWYGFIGGKCFSVGAAAIWFVDWRAALIAAGIMLILLFTVKIMSAVGNSRGRFLPHIACCIRRAAYIGHYNMRPFGGTAYFPP